MALPNELKFLEKYIKFFKFEITQESITRCILWTLLFLGLAHFHAPQIDPQLPYAKEMAEQHLIPISTATSDPRWSRSDLNTLPENSTAWIAGSSIAIKPTQESDYNFLPSQIKTNVDQYVSLKMARRMLDTYTMVKDTIARKPAAMVIVLNPFWDLQDTSSFFKTNLINRGTSLWVNKQDWRLIPALSSPGNILWASVGSKHNLINNSYDYLKAAQLKYAPSKKKNKTPPQEEKISYNQPTLFWMMNRYNDNKDFENFDAKAWQAEVMAQNNITQSQWGLKLLNNILSSIKDNNIPTLIYLAPTNPALEKTPAREALQTIQGQVSLAMQSHKADNIHYVVVPQSVIKSMTYIDYLHVSDSGQFPAFLSKEISAMMEAK